MACLESEEAAARAGSWAAHHRVMEMAAASWSSTPACVWSVLVSTPGSKTLSVEYDSRDGVGSSDGVAPTVADLLSRVEAHAAIPAAALQVIRGAAQAVDPIRRCLEPGAHQARGHACMICALLPPPPLMTHYYTATTNPSCERQVAGCL